MKTEFANSIRITVKTDHKAICSIQEKEKNVRKLVASMLMALDGVVENHHPSVVILPGPLESFSAHKTTALFLRDEATLDETERKELLLIQQASPTAHQAYLLVQAFMQMLRERTGDYLDEWLKKVQDSHIPEFDSFATGIQRDKPAVRAGLTLRWSNGPTEGHVNRLKLIKHSMYGRAKFDLLRARVLYAA
ncbi:MAG: transposase [Ktedonobacteraceae bacterium]|nr:transposase [Ktedonobacteraceae bacterium]